MRKLTVMLFACLMMVGQVWAQTRTITGTVKDEAGDPIEGASVTVKGSRVGTTTDADGTFSISVPATAKTIVVSSVGFAPMEFPASGTINALLKPGGDDLQEVIVTGYTREKKSTYVGSSATISGKVIENVPVAAFDQALQGRLPGVQVQSGSGQPGSSANITIRGIGSVQAAFAQPLYVIDGVPMPSFDMASINANDFENITVLKDANATALYGSRGANGVIVITTKRGKAGKPKFSFRSAIGFTQPPNATNFEMMNTEETLAYQEFAGRMGANITTPGWVYSRNNPNYNVLQAQFGFNNLAAQQAFFDRTLDSLRNIDQNHADYLFRQGLSQNYELNMSGGSEQTRYFLSMAYFDQEGTDLRSRLQRYTMRFNFDQKVGDKFNLQWNSLVGFSKSNFSNGDVFAANGTGTPFPMSWRGFSYENPFRPDGSLVFGPSTALNPRAIGNLLENIENSLFTSNQLKINSGLTLIYKIAPGLTARQVVGIDASFDRDKLGIRANSFIGSQQTLNNGFQRENGLIRSNLVSTSSLTYNKRIKDVHEIEASGNFEIVRVWNYGLGFQLFNLNRNLDFSGQNTNALPSGGPQNAASARSEFGIRSYFGTLRYTFDDKYTINGNLRRDGTSRILNPANREITTFSVGASWNAMRENFMQNQSFFQDLKVRGSYGSVPNLGSIANTNFGVFGRNVPNYLGPQLASFQASNAFSNNSPIAGLTPQTPGNPDYRIEYVEMANIGFDLAAFKNRVRLTTDFYRNITKDMFVNQPTSSTAGFFGEVQPINAGTMRNQGIEFQLGVDLIRNKNTTLTFGWTHAINDNVILDLGVVDEYVLGTFIIREGLPYGSHYAYEYRGADPATGRPRWSDANGNPTTNFAQAVQKANFGTWVAKHVGGFNLDLVHKRYSMSLLFSYQTNVSRYNNIWSWVTRGDATFTNAVRQSRALIGNVWERPGDEKFYSSPAFDRQFTSADIQDAKFLRFRGLNLGYSIPGISTNKGRLFESAKFYANFMNLFIWSPWRGPDPEDNNNISLGEFPNPRMLNIGLDINF